MHLQSVEKVVMILQAQPCQEEDEEIGGSYEFVGGVVTVTPAASRGKFLVSHLLANNP